MNRPDWLAADLRRSLPGHVHYGDGWRLDDPAVTHSVAWAPGTGELYAVDEIDDVAVLGVFPDRASVESAATGWEAHQKVPGSLYWLRAAAHDATLPTTVEPPNTGRQAAVPGSSRLPGDRYRIDNDDGTWWELGWDRTAATYSARHHQPTGEPTEPETITRYGTSHRELRDVEDLEQVIGQRIEPGVAADLAVDKAYYSHPGRPPFLDHAGERLAEDAHAAQVTSRLPVTYHDWVRADPARAGDRVEAGGRWSGDDPADVRCLSWAPGTGEVYTVDADDLVEVLGMVDTEAALTTVLAGWETSSAEPDAVAWARAAIHTAEVATGPPLRPGRVATYDEWLAAEPARRTPHHDYGFTWTAEDPASPHRVSWVPTTGELYAVEQVRGRDPGRVEVLGVFPTTDAVDAALPGWEQHLDRPGSLYWLRQTITLTDRPRADIDHVATPGAGGDPVEPGREARHVREADLAAREADLSRRERQLAAQQAALRVALDVEPWWALPAGPVAELLTDVQRGTGDDLATVAKGFDVDPGWAAGVLAGDVTEVDLPHVQQLCEAIHCSPYDLWGRDEAQHVLHAYGPELWPRFIEPLLPGHLELPDDPAGPGFDL